jgi:hypothetical protein
MSSKRGYTLRIVFTDSPEADTINCPNYATVLAVVAGHIARGVAFVYTLHLDGVLVEDAEHNDPDTNNVAGLALLALDTYRHKLAQAEAQALSLAGAA